MIGNLGFSRLRSCCAKQSSGTKKSENRIRDKKFLINGEACVACLSDNLNAVRVSHFSLQARFIDVHREIGSMIERLDANFY